jgi:hypothetical protein
MIEKARDEPGPVVCGRSGLHCSPSAQPDTGAPCPFRLLKTSADDRSPLNGRPFKCRECGSPAATLFAIESQAELEGVQAALVGPSRPVTLDCERVDREGRADRVQGAIMHSNPQP